MVFFIRSDKAFFFSIFSFLFCGSGRFKTAFRDGSPRLETRDALSDLTMFRVNKDVWSTLTAQVELIAYITVLIITLFIVIHQKCFTRCQ